jgi:hypothetical protein
VGPLFTTALRQIGEPVEVNEPHRGLLALRGGDPIYAVLYDQNHRSRASACSCAWVGRPLPRWGDDTSSVILLASLPGNVRTRTKKTTGCYATRIEDKNLTRV